MKEFIIPYSDEISDEDVKQLYGANRRLIRCKDCDNRVSDGRAGTIVCGITGESHSRLWFCGDGERNENDEQ